MKDVLSELKELNIVSSEEIKTIGLQLDLLVKLAQLNKKEIFANSIKFFKFLADSNVALSDFLSKDNDIPSTIEFYVEIKRYFPRMLKIVKAYLDYAVNQSEGFLLDSHYHAFYIYNDMESNYPESLQVLANMDFSQEVTSKQIKHTSRYLEIEFDNFIDNSDYQREALREFAVMHHSDKGRITELMFIADDYLETSNFALLVEVIRFKRFLNENNIICKKPMP